jgi:hypothetical protein
MTRKETFETLIPRRTRIKLVFNDTINFLSQLKATIRDSVHDNGGNEIMIENGNYANFSTPQLKAIMLSLEKIIFASNKELSAHTLNRDLRQDSNIRFTITENGFKNISASCYFRSRWSKFFYDYDNYPAKWHTFYTSYDLTFFLDENWNPTSAQICFIDLNEATYLVYPDNEIDIEDMKSRQDMEEVRKSNINNKENWGN